MQEGVWANMVNSRTLSAGKGETWKLYVGVISLVALVAIVSGSVRKPKDEGFYLADL